MHDAFWLIEPTLQWGFVEYLVFLSVCASRAARQIDALVNRSKTKLYSHSPNDVLVQIALPLILILAIIARLTMVASSMMAQQDTGPAVMELWKQQVILRIDRVLDDWESDANLDVFSSFSNVKWQGSWPNDERYKQLCNKAQELNDRDALRQSVLADAILSQKNATALSLSAVVPGGDLALEAGSAEAAYAEEYISQRLAHWSDNIEQLHWETVGYIAEQLPLESEAGAFDARTQLQRIAADLAERGYPLVSAVRAEYGGEEK